MVRGICRFYTDVRARLCSHREREKGQPRGQRRLPAPVRRDPSSPSPMGDDKEAGRATKDLYIGKSDLHQLGRRMYFGPKVPVTPAPGAGVSNCFSIFLRGLRPALRRGQLPVMRRSRLGSCREALLLEPVRDPAPLEVVRAYLDLDAVTREHPDAMHAHFAGIMGQHFVAVVGLHAERSIFEGLHDGPFEQDRLLLGIPVGQLPTSWVLLPGARRVHQGAPDGRTPHSVPVCPGGTPTRLPPSPSGH